MTKQQKSMWDDPVYQAGFEAGRLMEIMNSGFVHLISQAVLVSNLPNIQRIADQYGWTLIPGDPIPGMEYTVVTISSGTKPPEGTRPAFKILQGGKDGTE